MNDQIKSLHACWCAGTGQVLNLQATERIFFELTKLDFDANDLLCVIKHVLAYNKTHPNAQMKVQVHKICGDVEAFASICAEARARERNRIKPTTPKESVLESWRGVKPESNGNCHKLSEFLKVPQ